MPLTLDDTVGGAASTAYTDVATADAWAALRVGGSAWLALTADQKVQALVTATQDLDALESAIGFCGDRASESQALAWPRTGTDYSDAVIPTPLERATIELAMSYAPVISDATADVLNPETNGNVKREKVGPIDVEYWGPGEAAVSLTHYPRIVQQYLSAILCEPKAATWGTADVVRTS